MFGLALGLGVLLAIVAATKAHAATSAPDVSASVSKIMASGDPHMMLKASEVASTAGNRQLAAALQQKARDAAAASPTAVYPSPFPNEIPTAAWSSFVHALRGGRPDEITPAYHLGMFGFSMPRLVDLGFASNPVKVKRGDRTVWTATFAPPLGPGPETFLGSAALQYRIFIEMIKADIAAIHANHPEAIGSDIDGTKATASGLLGVAKQAGHKGLGEWLASAETRAKFPNTTAQFRKVNGIF